MQWQYCDMYLNYNKDCLQIVNRLTPPLPPIIFCLLYELCGQDSAFFGCGWIQYSITVYKLSNGCSSVEIDFQDLRYFKKSPCFINKHDFHYCVSWFNCLVFLCFYLGNILHWYGKEKPCIMFNSV